MMKKHEVLKLKNVMVNLQMNVEVMKLKLNLKKQQMSGRKMRGPE
jgi:hypothetical protein